MLPGEGGAEREQPGQLGVALQHEVAGWADCVKEQHGGHSNICRKCLQTTQKKTHSINRSSIHHGQQNMEKILVNLITKQDPGQGEKRNITHIDTFKGLFKINVQVKGG